MNKYKNYKWKELWDSETWKNRKSEIIPLAEWIGRWNLANNRIPAKAENEQNKEGEYDHKANALNDSKVINYWKEKGLHYHSTSMGKDGWVAMVPEDHLGYEGYDDDMDTVIVLVNANMHDDPNWCSYVLEKYSDYVESAARERFAIQFIVSDVFDDEDEYISIAQEAVIIFHFNYRRYFFDVSSVLNAGRKLKDIPGFHYTDAEGKEEIDPDAAVEMKGSIPVINITNRWLNKDSLIQKLVMGHVYSNLGFDRESFLSSEMAEQFAEAMSLEYLYDDAHDERLMKKWDDMGLACEFHEKKGEQWITFVPKQALEEPEKKIPCMCVFQEVDAFDPHQAVTAFAYCYEFHKLASQGEFMLLYFVLEEPEDNFLLHDILEDAKKMYPIDEARVYLTGHSHDGRFSLAYTRTHQDEITAVATLGNEPGLINPKFTGGFFRVTDEDIKQLASKDIPLINLCGTNERNCMFPLYTDAPDMRPGDHIALDTAPKRVDSWQRRLEAMRCPMKTEEEIYATKDSEDVVIRTLGIPADHTSFVHIDGSDNYIADIKNYEGKYHFRIVALGNMPHTITPVMTQLAWSFLKRFAKDPKTGECVELY